VVLHEELSNPAVAQNASRILSRDLAEFVRVEAQLHELTHVRKSIYNEVVKEVSPWIKSSLRPDFPRTAEEFRIEFDRMYATFLGTIRRTPMLPRRMSKEAKTAFMWQFWRYSLGSLITLANIYVSYHQPSFEGMGSTSVTVGAWYFWSGRGGPRKPPATASGQANDDSDDIHVNE
jgi:hypothetical protein